MEGARRDAAADAERAARATYGRLLAILAARDGDIAGAEDALADAFASALTTWPIRGVPDKPVAWLLTAARRSKGHARGRRATASAGATTLALLSAERGEADADPFGDARLKLLFVCTHPAIAVEMQAPLMLQIILGLDAARIANCFLVSPAVMGRRLGRVKTKIRAAGIAFAVPDRETVGARLGAVLAAIYAAYGTAWEDVLGADAKRRGLADEAIWLCRLVIELMPEAPEALGLLALMLFCEARLAARRDSAGRFVPLGEQDIATWSAAMITEAEGLLNTAARAAAPGRFQTEAAIQSLHVQQRVTGVRLAVPLATLYDLLAEQAPSTGGLVARAVAHGEAGAAVDALALLDPIEGGERYQPWWTARARLLWLAGDHESARAAAAHAAGLTGDPAVRDFLTSGRLFRPPNAAVSLAPSRRAT